MDSNMILGRKMREFRKSKKLRQYGLAKLMNVSTDTISKYEIGKANIPLETAVQFARLAGISLDDLLELNTPEEEKEQKKAQFLEAVWKLAEEYLMK